MVRQFCTLFDINYLPRGLVMYRSLERTSPSYRLWVFCMDAETAGVLRRLDLPSLNIVSLSDLEAHNPELLSTKRDRTQVEYCWTATPAVCRYVLDVDDEATEVTYLDADLMFFSDPEPLFDELGDRATLIVPHRYAPEHRHKEPTSGTYNVEWLTFRRDPDGLAALHWWHDRCIEWCYFRWEDGKLGDQKYLDDFPRLFDRVRVLEHPGGGLAPWNVTAHHLDEQDGRVEVDGRPLVFYHYHSLRLYCPTLLARAAVALGRLRPGVPPLERPWRTNYPVGDAERQLVWEPYLHELGVAALALNASAPGALSPDETYPAVELIRAGYRLARRLAGKALHTCDWAQFLLFARTRYRDSWRDENVARQMAELTEQQLVDPDSVAPYRAFRELLIHLADDPALPQPARLLDIGAGAGAYGELVDRWTPGRFEYTGADYSEPIVAAATARWPGRTFVQQNVFDAGALDGFDVILASALLDVLADVGNALDVLLRADARWVLLHRQRIHPRRTHVEVASGYRGQRTYRSYLTRDALAAAAARHGREIVAAVDVEGDVRSFVLKRL